MEPFTELFIDRSTYLFLHLSIFVTIYQSIYLSIHLSIMEPFAEVEALNIMAVVWKKAEPLENKGEALENNRKSS